MNVLNDYIGKNIKCSEEWWMGEVYYENIYKKDNEFFASKKIYVYNKKVDTIIRDGKVFVPLGFKEISEINFDDFEI